MIFQLIFYFLLILIIAFFVLVIICVLNSPYVPMETDQQYKFGENIHKLPVLDFSRKHEASHTTNAADTVSPTAAETSSYYIMKQPIAEKLIRMYKKIQQYLSAKNVDVWAVRSTWLGTVRHDGLIPWKPHIELAFSQENIARVVSIRDELENDDLRLIKTIDGYVVCEKNSFSRFPNVILNIMHVRNDEVAVCSELDELGNCTYSRSAQKRVVIFDVKDVFPLKDSIFEGMSIKIPQNVENCLVQMYGKNFMHEVNKMSEFPCIFNDFSKSLVNRMLGK